MGRGVSVPLPTPMLAPLTTGPNPRTSGSWPTLMRAFLTRGAGPDGDAVPPPCVQSGKTTSRSGESVSGPPAWPAGLAVSRSKISSAAALELPVTSFEGPTEEGQPASQGQRPA